MDLSRILSYIEHAFSPVVRSRYFMPLMSAILAVCFVGSAVQSVRTAEAAEQSAAAQQSTVSGPAQSGDDNSAFVDEQRNRSYSAGRVGGTFPGAFSVDLMAGDGSTGVSSHGIALIKSYESCSLTAYKALPSERYYSIGWGHYSADVTEDAVITQEQADALFLQDVRKIESVLNSFLNTYSISVNQNQYDALVSLTYNLGNIWSSSAHPTFALKEYLINGVSNYTDDEIRAAFVEWNHAGGSVLTGLTNRRNAEADMFLSSTSDPNSIVCLTGYAGTYSCTGDPALVIRSAPNSSADIVGKIPRGASVYVAKASGSGSSDWAYVTYNGVSGYSSMQHLNRLTYSTPSSSASSSQIGEASVTGGQSNVWYCITFDPTGGSAVQEYWNVGGTELSLDEFVTEREGHRFTGWYTNPECTQLVDSLVLQGNLTLYAGWSEASAEQQEPGQAGASDIAGNEWYAAAVQSVLANGWMSSVNGAFAPDSIATCGDLLCGLCRAVGNPGASVQFAGSWAVEQGMALGYYAPGNALSRQQMAVMVQGYAAWRGWDTHAYGTDLSAWADGDSVPEDMREAVCWALNTGLLRTDGNGCINPNNGVSRAEVAVILTQFGS